MSNHRAGLLLIVSAVAIAGVIVGYALAGLNDPVTQAQPQDTVPLLQAIATSVAPMEPTMDATAVYLDSLPACSDPTTAIGEVCLPVYTKSYECESNYQVYVRAQAIPCTKRDEH